MSTLDLARGMAVPSKVLKHNLGQVQERSVSRTGPVSSATGLMALAEAASNRTPDEGPAEAHNNCYAASPIAGRTNMLPTVSSPPPEMGTHVYLPPPFATRPLAGHRHSPVRSPFSGDESARCSGLPIRQASDTNDVRFVIPQLHLPNPSELLSYQLELQRSAFPATNPIGHSPWLQFQPPGFLPNRTDSFLYNAQQTTPHLPPCIQPEPLRVVATPRHSVRTDSPGLREESDSYQTQESTDELRRRWNFDVLRHEENEEQSPVTSSTGEDDGSDPSFVDEDEVNNRKGRNGATSNSLRPIGRIKKKRASPQQVAVLEQFFADDPLPSSAAQRALAEDIGMSPRSVQLWFQNKRAKMRRMGKKIVPKQKGVTFHHFAIADGKLRVTSHADQPTHMG